MRGGSMAGRVAIPYTPRPFVREDTNAMKIHEFQAKELFRKYGLPVPEGRECKTADEAARAYDELDSEVCVVKAQIHAGGRGKGGGVKLVRSAAEARAAAEAMLGMQLVTHQTGPEGQEVRRLLVEQGSAIKRELYVGVAIDRESSRPVLMVSTEGGMDIEEVAAQTPEKILKAKLSPAGELDRQDGLRLVRGLKMPPGLEPHTVQFLVGIAKLFCELDCSLVEVNPLVQTDDGKLVALDGKINFDPNALFRHPDLVELRDRNEEEPLELEASEHDLNYIKLDGTIGCMVNGAGLAMSTMDVIKLYGAEPANFLDVGGGATKEQVMAAFRILLKDPGTQAVLVNIFGGIMKCDVIAEGIIGAAKELAFDLPLIVRLEGTNVEQGRALLEDSGLTITTATDLDDAAQKACAAHSSSAPESSSSKGARA
jgi:succinyl-CoA synthetase beta subunit